MKRMTGAQAALATLEINGIDTIFGIPGGHSLDIYDALAKSNTMRHILGRHEQGLGFMADGFSRASGKIGAITTTSGPAVANLACAMGQATTDTSSVLAISSTVRSDMIGKNKGGLHDLNESLDIMRPVCRYVRRCDKVQEIPDAINELIFNLRSSRPGGAYCEIPCDILSQEHTFDLKEAPAANPPKADPAKIIEACKLLATAQRPVIWAGTGALVSGASQQIQQLSELVGAMVIPTVLAKGILPADAPNVVSIDGALFTEVNEVVAQADVVLAVGTMFKQEDTAAWQTKMGEKLIHIDIDPEEMGRSYQPDIALVADAKEALLAILDNLPACTPSDSDWLAKGRAAQEDRLDKRRQDSPTEMQALDALQAAVPPNGIIVADRCNLGYWAFRCFGGRQPRTFQYPMGYGGLGGALPQAIGAKLACPQKPVVCLIGDGGFQFTATELAVAVQEDVPITIVICNNKTYGAIRAGQQKNFGGRLFGVDLINPDFQALAAAYAVPACVANNPQQLEQSLKSAIASGWLSIIELTLELCDP